MPKANRTSITKPVSASQAKLFEDYETLVSHIDNEVATLKHLTHFLAADLDNSLSPRRGREDKFGGITLVFQPDSIEATTWLAGEVWVRITRLDEHLLAFHNACAKQERSAA